MSALLFPGSCTEGPRADPRRRALLCVPALFALGLIGCATVERELPNAVSPFSTAPVLGGLPAGWEELVLRRDLPLTDYHVAELDGRRVLRASGRGASGLRCRVKADPLA